MKKSFNGVIFGTLLGDSIIHHNGKSFNCKQVNEQLIRYKFHFIKENLKPYKIQVIEYNPYFDGKWHHQKLYELRCKDKYFEEIYPLFYKNRERYINQEVLDALNFSGIALWYADDGSTSLIGINSKKIRSRRVELCTDRYVKDDLTLISNFFEKRLNEKGCITLIPRKYKGYQKEHYRIRFNLKSSQLLFSKIYRNFLDHYPSLLYKMDLGYRDELLDRKNITEDYKKLFHECKAHEEFIDRLALNDIV